MAYSLQDAMPLPKSMLTYSRLDHKEHILRKLHLKFKKMHSKMASARWQPFFTGLNMLTLYSQPVLQIYIQPRANQGILSLELGRPDCIVKAH